MKIKQFIYFSLISVGALIMGFGGSFMQKEYALAVGIIFLMFGVYKISTSWTATNEEPKDDEI